jgi:hypothetical protein
VHIHPLGALVNSNPQFKPIHSISLHSNFFSTHIIYLILAQLHSTFPTPLH